MRVFVNTVMKLQKSLNIGNFSTTVGTVGFRGETVLRKLVSIRRILWICFLVVPNLAGRNSELAAGTDHQVVGLWPRQMEHADIQCLISAVRIAYCLFLHTRKHECDVKVSQ